MSSPEVARLPIEQALARLALSVGELGEFEWDAGRDMILVSPRMAVMTGAVEGEKSAEAGRFPLAFIHPEDRPAARNAVADAFAGEQAVSAELRVIRADDGKTVWVEATAVAVRAASGEVTGLIGVLRDIAKRKTADAAQDALVAELDHRLKNVLATINSLAGQLARRTTSADAFIKMLAGRLEAMEAANTLLARTRWRGAEIGDLVAAEVGALSYGRARWSGPGLVLNPRATNVLSLTLHELATNSVKFGALSSESGRVEIRWFDHPQGGIELVWTERHGPPVGPPERHGFGSTLFDRVAGRELHGSARLEFRRTGVVATLHIGGEALADPGELRRPVADLHDELAPAAGMGVEPQSVEIGGVRILIVEDAVLLALELESALTERGAVVVGPATSAEQANALLDENFDVVLLDAELSEHAAATIAAELTKRGRPFILASGHGDDDAVMIETPAAVVRKPYNVGQIALAVAKAAGRLQTA